MNKRAKEMARHPTREALEQARSKGVPDLIAPRLRVLFCGINPGLYSAAVGHHFARPGNRFWPALYAGGFTPILLSPDRERELLPLGYGIVNVVERATAAADELTCEELVEGGKKLLGKVRRYKPACIAILGVGAYRSAFNPPGATSIGLQPDSFAGAKLWVLPNPSGLNAHYPLSALASLLAELRKSL